MNARCRAFSFLACADHSVIPKICARTFVQISRFLLRNDVSIAKIFCKKCHHAALFNIFFNNIYLATIL